MNLGQTVPSQFSSTCSSEELLRTSGIGFPWTGCPSCQPTESVKSPKETQSTDSNQWLAWPHSLFILLRQGTLLPLRWLADASTLVAAWMSGKGKERYLHSTILVHTHTPKAIPHFHLKIMPCLPFLRKHSPDGTNPNWGSRHPTAAYYSLIDPEGMKGWVGLVGWPTADGLPT